MKSIKESIIGRKGVYSPDLYIFHPCAEDYDLALDILPKEHMVKTKDGPFFYCIDKIELERYLRKVGQHKLIGPNIHRKLNESSTLYKVIGSSDLDQIKDLLKTHPFVELKNLVIRIA